MKYGLKALPQSRPSMVVFRRRYSIVAVAIFCSTVVIYWSWYQSRFQFPKEFLPPKEVVVGDSWDFSRDARNLLMNDAQCDAAFPDLFVEIDRAVASRRNNHITLKEINEVEKVRGYTRAMIYDQNLYIIDAGENVNMRDMATLHALHRAIVTSPEPLPNIEFVMNVDDMGPEKAGWAFTRQADEEKIWLMPDFGYWSWPEPKIGAWSEVRMKATQMDTKKPWVNKNNKLIWRGNVMDLKVRENLLDAAAGKPWSDVRVLDWIAEGQGKSHDRLTMDRHCSYKFVAHTEGVTYSARLQNLQNCRSVIVAHKLKWIQHHTHLMRSTGPQQNYVEVAYDWSDLDKTMENLLANDTEAERIANNNVRMFREQYLTPAAETCYWRKLIRGWASVSFEPSFTSGTGADEVWRGLPIESYVLEGRLEW